jgi:hypothetical protein
MKDETDLTAEHAEVTEDLFLGYIFLLNSALTTA